MVVDNQLAEGFAQSAHHLVPDLALHQDAAARSACLAGVLDDAVDDGGEHLVDVGIVEDDLRRLATQLERHARVVAARRRLHQAPDLG